MFWNRKKKESINLTAKDEETKPVLSPFQIKLNKINQDCNDEKERANKEVEDKIKLKITEKLETILETLAQTKEAVSTSELSDLLNIDIFPRRRNLIVGRIIAEECEKLGLKLFPWSSHRHEYTINLVTKINQKDI